MVISRDLGGVFGFHQDFWGGTYCRYSTPTQAEYDKTEKLQSDLAIPDRAIADSLLYQIPETLKFLYQQNSPVIPDAPYYARRPDRTANLQKFIPCFTYKVPCYTGQETCLT